MDEIKPPESLADAADLLRRSAQAFKEKSGDYMHLNITLEEKGPRLTTNLPTEAIPTLLMMIYLDLVSGGIVKVSQETIN